MGDILTINGTDFCNDTLNVNAVTVPNTLNVDSITKNCGPSACYTCGPLQFAMHDSSCDDACEGSCSFYYSKDYGSAGGGPATGCTECNLQVGVPIYSDTLCTLVGSGYYSPNNCAVHCDRCYTVVAGIITNITTCPDECTPCDSGVQLTFSEFSCLEACENTECELYFSDGDCEICPLIVGDYLWTDTLCTIAPAGYYSPKNCEGAEPCEHCYEVDGTGKIITVTTCDGFSTCREVNMTIIPQETCKDACEDESCVVRYTDRAEGELIQAGDHIYDDDRCECDDSGDWGGSFGFWQVWYGECGVSPISPYYNQCIYKESGTCQISAVESCSEDHDDPVDED